MLQTAPSANVGNQRWARAMEHRLANRSPRDRERTSAGRLPSAELVRTARRAAAIELYAKVVLTRDIVDGDSIHPRRAEGTIVHRYSDGKGYEVEIGGAHRSVLTVDLRDIEPVRGYRVEDHRNEIYRRRQDTSISSQSRSR